MTRTFLFIVAILLPTCTHSADRSGPVEKTLTARRVRLDVEQGGKNVVVKGDELRLDLETLKMDLVGNASVTIDEPVSLRAHAARITFKQSFEVVELVGDVHAYIGSKKQDRTDGKSSSR